MLLPLLLFLAFIVFTVGQSVFNYPTRIDIENAELVDPLNVVRSVSMPQFDAQSSVGGGTTRNRNNNNSQRFSFNFNSIRFGWLQFVSASIQCDSFRLFVALFGGMPKGARGKSTMQFEFAFVFQYEICIAKSKNTKRSERNDRPKLVYPNWHTLTGILPYFEYNLEEKSVEKLNSE